MVWISAATGYPEKKGERGRHSRELPLEAGDLGPVAARYLGRAVVEYLCMYSVLKFSSKFIFLVILPHKISIHRNPLERIRHHPYYRIQIGALKRLRKGWKMTKMLLVFASALALAGPAHAAGDTPSRSLSVRDVNFGDTAQTQMFYQRLERTARQVCGNSLADARVTGMSDRTCVRLSMTEVVRTINAPQLTAMLNGAYGAESANKAFAADAR